MKINDKLLDKNWCDTVRKEQNYREFVGPSDEYDMNAGLQFSMLIHLGLREHHKLLDIGCGSLRGGRLYIPYLNSKNYFGIEPERWLVDKGIEYEVGHDILSKKKPNFIYSTHFPCNKFDISFDYLLAQGVFTHSPKNYIENCVKNASMCMLDTSLFVFTYFQDDTDHVGTDWLYPSTSQFKKETMSEIGSNNGLLFRNINWPHPRNAQWAVFYRSLQGSFIDDFCNRSKAMFA
ncbi:hypothetical protein N9408_06700 [Opitutales bacterium]|nr:hypothetical protein [Opitutales bacterium]